MHVVTGILCSLVFFFSFCITEPLIRKKMHDVFFFFASCSLIQFYSRVFVMSFHTVACVMLCLVLT